MTIRAVATRIVIACLAHAELPDAANQQQFGDCAVTPSPPGGSSGFGGALGRKGLRGRKRRHRRRACQSPHGSIRIWLDNDAASPNSFWKNVQDGGMRGTCEIVIWCTTRYLRRICRSRCSASRNILTARSTTPFPQMLAIAATTTWQVASRDKLFIDTFEGGGRTFVSKGAGICWRNICPESHKCATRPPPRT